MFQTSGQGIDFVAFHRIRNSDSSPQGHNYRLWAAVTGPLRPATGLILPRSSLDQALASIAREFDHKDFTDHIASGDRPLAALAAAIWRQLALNIRRPAELAKLEISDETGQGVRLSRKPSISISGTPGTQAPPSTAGTGDGESGPPRVSLTFTLSGGFSAAHRAHAPRLSDDENRAMFGTSNNPAGHGHNYWVEIESPSPLPDQPAPWAALDHLNLSHDVAELQGRNAVTEAVAELLARRTPSASLVRVWESPELFADFNPAAARYRLGRRYRFHAAHNLVNSSLSQAANRRRYGRCALGGLHGHAYTAYVVVEGELDPLSGTTYNLAVLDAGAGALLRSFDYSEWRQVLPELDQAPATAEQAAVAIWRRLDGLLGASLVEFTLCETPGQGIQVKRGPDG